MQGDIPYNEGIIPLTLKEIFDKINSTKDIINSKITVSFIEIYNESINDLLNVSNINLELREMPNKEVIVNNLTEIKVNNHEEALNLLLKGNNSRIVASTKLNEKSSRSHCIFRLNLEITKNKEDKALGTNEKITLKSLINLIDLAGSENSSKTGCVGQRLKEGSNINKSLLALSNVINKLSQNNGNNIGGGNFFVNYRDSKLTRLLQNSLGGNSKTAIICTVTDDSEHYTETMNTLHFGNKAKNIKTVVKVNEMKNQNSKEMILENERLKKKVKELERELTTQKKLNLNEMLNYNEANIKINDINIASPPKINLNKRFLLCNMTNNSSNNGDMIINNNFSNKTSSLSFNRTQLALNNMEKELFLLKKYLLSEQKDNINNNKNINSYLEICSLSSSEICRNLMCPKNESNLPNFHEIDYSQNLKLMKYSNNNNICNVENFVLNETKDKNDKIKQLEEENNRLKYELSLIKNINIESPLIDLDETLVEKNNNINNDNEKQEYFLNNGRKVQLSKFSEIKFIKNLSNQIKNFNKNENDDIQILIQLNQTIKNLNQNIISDINTKKNNDKAKNNIDIGKENLLLNRKRQNKNI